MRYYYKVWLFTITTSPLLAFSVLWIRNSARFDAIITIPPLWFFAIVCGGFFSLPSLFLFLLLCRDLENRAIHPIKKKIIFSLTGIVLVCCSFLVVYRNWFANADLNDVILSAFYSLCLSGGVFLYKDRPQEETVF